MNMGFRVVTKVDTYKQLDKRIKTRFQIRARLLARRWEQARISTCFFSSTPYFTPKKDRYSYF